MTDWPPWLPDGQADLLIVLSIVDGLLSGDPTDPTSRRIPLVERFDDELLNLTVTSKSSRGTGGMKTETGSGENSDGGRCECHHR